MCKSTDTRFEDLLVTIVPHYYCHDNVRHGFKVYSDKVAPTKQAKVIETVKAGSAIPRRLTINKNSLFFQKIMESQRQNSQGAAVSVRK